MILKMAAVVKVQYSIIFCKDIFTTLSSLSILKRVFGIFIPIFLDMCPHTPQQTKHQQLLQMTT